MIFSDEAIDLCRQLKRAGLAWEPTPGQYVLDEDQIFHHVSPFQPHLFFILDLQHFLRYTQTIESMKQRMTWLLTWHDARSILSGLQCEWPEIEHAMAQSKAFEQHKELEQLLKLILQRLSNAN